MKHVQNWKWAKGNSHASCCAAKNKFGLPTSNPPDYFHSLHPWAGGVPRHPGPAHPVVPGLLDWWTTHRGSSICWSLNGDSQTSCAHLVSWNLGGSKSKLNCYPAPSCSLALGTAPRTSLCYWLWIRPSDDMGFQCVCHMLNLWAIWSQEWVKHPCHSDLNSPLPKWPCVGFLKEK